MAKFSERLRELRKERGLKQREMAEICGLKLRGYQQYEYNESYPEVPGLVALADFFGVSLDYLMGRSDKREILSLIHSSSFSPSPDGSGWFCLTLSDSITGGGKTQPWPSVLEKSHSSPPLFSTKTGEFPLPFH